MPAEPAARPPARQSRLDILLDLLIEVQSQFLVELTFDHVTPSEGAKAKEQIRKHRRHRYARSRTCPTTSTSRRQDSVADSSRTRPVRVSSQYFARRLASVVRHDALIKPARSSPMQGGVECALPKLQRVTGDLLESLGERPAMQRLQRQGLEDQQFEHALGQRQSVGHAVSPFTFDTMMLGLFLSKCKGSWDDSEWRPD
jgi:hypothetical protein